MSALRAGVTARSRSSVAHGRRPGPRPERSFCGDGQVGHAAAVNSPSASPHILQIGGGGLCRGSVSTLRRFLYALGVCVVVLGIAAGPALAATKVTVTISDIRTTSVQVSWTETQDECFLDYRLQYQRTTAAGWSEDVVINSSVTTSDQFVGTPRTSLTTSASSTRTARASRPLTRLLSAHSQAPAPARSRRRGLARSSFYSWSSQSLRQGLASSSGSWLGPGRMRRPALRARRTRRRFLPHTSQSARPRQRTVLPRTRADRRAVPHKLANPPLRYP